MSISLIPFQSYGQPGFVASIFVFLFAFVLLLDKLLKVILHNILMVADNYVYC